MYLKSPAAIRRLRGARALRAGSVARSPRRSPEITGPSGQPLGHRIETPEALYRAQHGSPPDLLVFFGDLDYRAAGTIGHGRVHLPHNNTGADACNHDWDGLFVHAGPGSAPSAAPAAWSIFDVTNAARAIRRRRVRTASWAAIDERLAPAKAPKTGAAVPLWADLKFRGHAQLSAARTRSLIMARWRGSECDRDAPGAGGCRTCSRRWSAACTRRKSVLPPATLPNWATSSPGVDPGVHGVFDFTTRHGYGVRFTAGRIREAPTFFRALDRAGKKTACLFFPGTYPPEPLQHGVFASGWDAPVAFAADASFIWPRSLHAELVQRFGAQTFDDVDEFHADAPGFHDALGDAWCDG